AQASYPKTEQHAECLLPTWRLAVTEHDGFDYRKPVPRTSGWPNSGQDFRVMLTPGPLSLQYSCGENGTGTRTITAFPFSARDVDTMARGISVVLADDHVLFRQALRHLLEMEPDVRVVAETGDGATAIELVEKYRPDV